MSELPSFPTELQPVTKTKKYKTFSPEENNEQHELTLQMPTLLVCNRDVIKEGCHESKKRLKNTGKTLNLYTFFDTYGTLETDEIQDSFVYYFRYKLLLQTKIGTFK